MLLLQHIVTARSTKWLQMFVRCHLKKQRNATLTGGAVLALVHRTGNGSFVAPGPGNYQCATQQIGQDDLQRSPGQDPTVCGRNRKERPVVTELSGDQWEKGNIRYVRFADQLRGSKLCWGIGQRNFLHIAS